MFKWLKIWFKNKKKGKVKNYYKARLHSMPKKYKPDVPYRKEHFEDYWMPDH